MSALWFLLGLEAVLAVCGGIIYFVARWIQRKRATDQLRAGMGRIRRCA